MVQIVSLSVMHAWILQGNLIESNFRARNDDRPARGLHCQYVGFERNMTNNCRRQRFNHIQWRSGCCRSFTLNINYCPPRQFASIYLERHLLRKADCCSCLCFSLHYHQHSPATYFKLLRQQQRKASLELAKWIPQYQMRGFHKHGLHTLDDQIERK